MDCLPNRGKIPNVAMRSEAAPFAGYAQCYPDVQATVSEIAANDGRAS